MSAFRPRAPRGPYTLTGSQHRRALRESKGIVVSSAEKHPDNPAQYRGLPADAHPTRRRGHPNPRWAGMMAGIRHGFGPYSFVPPPTPRLQKKRRPESDSVSPTARQRAATGEVV